MNGIIFDIKEFSLNDGAGIRTTVFMKGCPLRCVWCHNPEGLSPHRELFVKTKGCVHCGLCKKSCQHPECQGLGRCLHICPNNLVSAAGEVISSDELAKKLLKYDRLYSLSGGGVTLSGGEPLMQPEFCEELLLKLSKISTAIETSGFADEAVFRRICGLVSFVYMDIKLMDPQKHRTYTGVGNSQILENALWLKKSGIPHTFRTPLIPGITDTPENLSAIAAFVSGDSWEKLPYNALAAAKYPGVGRKFLYSPENPGSESLESE